MKITLTGSLGHIGLPLTKALVENGHSITVISSKPEKKKQIEALGASAAIGTLEDIEFLVSTFTGADAVYVMIPPYNFFEPNFDSMAYCKKIANNYADAIRRSRIKRVVHLSSIGAHMEEGSGLIMGHRHAEEILKTIPNLSLTHLRPAAFYYNLSNFIQAIKSQSVIVSNYGADDKVPWVSLPDIAAVVAEELVTSSAGRNVRYIASDEPTCNEIAAALGAAIGKPDLEWRVIPDEQMIIRLNSIGMPAQTALEFVEMNSCMHRGLLQEDYFRHRPHLGKIKIADFAKEFAIAYKQSVS